MVGVIVVRAAAAGHIESFSLLVKLVKDPIVMAPRHKQQNRRYHCDNLSTPVRHVCSYCKSTQRRQLLGYSLGLSGIVCDIAHKGQQQLQGRAAVPAGAVPHEHLDGVVDAGLRGKLGSRRGGCGSDMCVSQLGSYLAR
jgi:hypothetical protein